MAEQKEYCGARVSTWIKILNMILGILMVVYSVLTIFTVALDLFDETPILVITFRVYEM